MNPVDQPKVCCVCGGKIRKSDGDAQYHYDLAGGNHWSKHNKCSKGVGHVPPLVKEEHARN